MNIIHEKINLSGMRDISFKDEDRIRRLSSISPSQSCENSFATIFIWSSAYNTKILDAGEDCSFIYNPVDGILHYPLGRDVSPETLSRYVDTFKDAGLLLSNYVYNVPPEWPEKFPNADRFFCMVADPADEDYIYDVSRLSSLSGAKLRKKRNHIKRFQTEHPNFHAEDMNPGNLGETWDFIKRADLNKGLITEYQAAENAVKNFGKLGLEGLLLRDGNGEMLGASIFSRLSSDTFTIHFEKSRLDVEGAPQILVKLEADALIKRGAKYMNREQDLGDENLRHAKNSLDPQIKYRRLRAYAKQ